MITNPIMKRFLLTGGRAPAALELARLLSKAGHRVYIAESMSHHLCQYSKYIEKSYIIAPPRTNQEGFIADLIQIIQQENIDILLPTCEEVFYISKAYDQLSAYCSLFTSQIELMKTLHSKWRFIDLLRSYQVETPDTWLIHGKEEVIALLQTHDPHAELTWVLKPEFSRFSNHVIIFEGHSVPDVTMGIGRKWVLQQFIQGRQISTYGIAVDGCLKAYAAYAEDFTAGRGACINFQYENNHKLLTWVKDVVKSFNYTGQIAFDLIITKDGSIYPIECNPRTTSGIHLFAEHDNLDLAFLESHTSSLIEPSIHHKSMLLLAMILYALPKIRSAHQLISWLYTVMTSKDVLFRLRDPNPFFGQFQMVYELYKCSKKSKRSMIECSTMDIEWNGES